MIKNIIYRVKDSVDNYMVRQYCKKLIKDEQYIRPNEIELLELERQNSSNHYNNVI